jgi:hypothetical protein
MKETKEMKGARQTRHNKRSKNEKQQQMQCAMKTYFDVCHHCTMQTLCKRWRLCSQAGQAAQRPAITQRF